VQRLLRDDEVLLAYVVCGEHAFAVIIAARDQELVRLDATEASLRRDVDALRAALDERAGPSPLVFDGTVAARLADTLLGRALGRHPGASTLIIVPGEALAALPFAALVSAPAEPVLHSELLLRAAGWLSGSHRVMVLPSVASLVALRDVARTSRATLPFAGFGDPLLCAPVDGDHDCRASAAVPGDRARSRCLPETAAEIRAAAGALGASDDVVHLGSRFTRAAIRGLDLSRYRVVHFATHAVGASATRDGEAGLLVTPGAGHADAVLRASDIAQLQLDADCVVLSACDTAADHGLDGPSLSSLASAFFYAGARSLLVSQWAVDSDAAVRLVTEFFAGIVRHGEEPVRALQHAMQRMRDGAGDPAWSHPAYWAPFLLIGDGRHPMSPLRRGLSRLRSAASTLVPRRSPRAIVSDLSLGWRHARRPLAAAAAIAELDGRHPGGGRSPSSTAATRAAAELVHQVGGEQGGAGDRAAAAELVHQVGGEQGGVGAALASASK